MNQILENKQSKFIKRKKYTLLFCISVVVLLGIIIYFFRKTYSENNISKISDVTRKSHNITRLYSKEINSSFTANSSNTLIIGTIIIPKINISYPILSECSDNLLKISVCRFFGPSANDIGNLCIIGHNYNNGNFFSDLYLLDQNDIINIYDLNSNVVSYYIYEIKEINPDDLSYLNQNTNRK